MRGPQCRAVDLRRGLAACGIVAAAWFPLVVATLGALRPGYDHVADVLSKLGQVGSPNAWAMNTLGFGALGVLTLGFARAMHHRFPQVKAAAALLALGGAGILAVALLPCDPGCVETSALGRWHSPAAGVAATGMVLAVLLYARAWWDDPAWREHARRTLVLGVPSLVAGAMYTSRQFPAWMGGLQRLALAGPLLWMAWTGWRVLREQAR